MYKMKILVNLIGEQPIPNLLPIRYFNPDRTILLYTDRTEIIAKRMCSLVAGCEIKKTEAYDINSTLVILDSLNSSSAEIVINLTGGTKIMALAAYQFALKNNHEFIYIQSEGNNSIMYYYKFVQNRYIADKITLSELINLDFYLKAHLMNYKMEGFHKDSSGKLSSGGQFEKAIHDALFKDDFEVLAGIKPADVGNQIEIDLAVRLKGTNNVGIAEIKVGDYREEGPKKGLDQLVMAAEREYLGTYTSRFLITSRILSKKIKALAHKHRIHIIDGMRYNSSAKCLEKKSAEELILKLKQKLS